jgi:hypothetical protein
VGPVLDREVKQIDVGLCGLVGADEACQLVAADDVPRLEPDEARRGEDRLRVYSCLGRIDAGAGAGNHVGDRWPRRGIDEHAPQILLQGLAGPGGTSCELVANLGLGQRARRRIRGGALRAR